MKIFLHTTKKKIIIIQISPFLSFMTTSLYIYIYTLKIYAYPAGILAKINNYSFQKKKEKKNFKISI